MQIIISLIYEDFQVQWFIDFFVIKYADQNFKGISMLHREFFLN